GAEGRIVTALSGSETVEQAYALAKLLRVGLGAHSAVMPEAVSSALDASRLPLAAIEDAELVVVVGDDPVAERAPVVDLWLAAAAPGWPSSRTRWGGRASPAVARSTCPRRRTAAAWPRRGRQPRTPTRPTRSRSACSSSPATKPPPTRACARSQSGPNE